jgi:hypothetical protein
MATTVGDAPQPQTPGHTRGVWRGGLFRTLYDGLTPDEQRWVLDRIRHYLVLNAEQHIEAHL